MRPIALQMLPAVLLAALLAACSAKPLVYRHVPDRDAVVAVEASRGSTYVAELPFSAGTGFGWTASSYDDTIVKLASQKTRDAAPAGVVGGALVEEFTFELKRRGETVILFELKRPWEKDVSAAEVRSVRLRVQ